MSNKARLAKNFHWIPRGLSILFILFISSFALDVFEEKDWFLALLIHLIPSYFLIFSTIIAWKNDTLGGTLFLCAGLFFVPVSRLEGALIYGPAIALGLLYLLSGWLKKSHKKQETPSATPPT